MKKITTLFFVILCCITILKAEEVALIVHVETPGTLFDKIFDAGQRPALVTKLTVTGTLNDDDFTCMRETMTSLVDVDLSGITNTTGVNFKNKSNLLKILLPENLTSIGEWAFRFCESLTSITIPNSVRHIGGSAFAYCKSLTSITIPNSVISIGNRGFEECSSLTSITIPNNVTTIGEGTFSSCSSLTSITIPHRVASIEDFAFHDCDALTSITIPNSVTSIGCSAFSGCSSLTSIEVDTHNQYYTSIDGILYNKSITTIICCPGGKTSITIPNSVTSIGDYAFLGCSSLISITIPNSVTSIGIWAFHDCDALTSITIPNSVTSIGKYAFYVCSSLTSIIIPNSVTSIGDYAFAYCKSLTSMTIPNSVTSIGDYAFLYCTSLTSITIPNSVTSIGYNAFYRCSSLISITCLGSIPPIAGDLGADTKNCILRVPSEAYNDYSQHNYWGQFFNIEVISETPTNFETSKISSANIYTQNSTLHIEGATENYHVLDAAGRLIYSGNATTLQLPRGIYLVAMGGEVEKIVL